MLQRKYQHELLRHVPKIDIDYRDGFEQVVGIDLPIAVINLDHRPDRFSALYAHMASVGLDKLVRVPAVYGADLTSANVSDFLGRPASTIDGAPLSHLTLTRPAVGCFLSHLAVWRWVIDSNLSRVLILEDDAKPVSNFDVAHFRTVLTSLPKEADLVFAGSIIMHGLADQATHANLARVFYFNGTFAYLITPAGCRRLIDYLDPPHWHIDHQISKVLFERRVVFSAYRTVPEFFEADWTLRSDCYVPLEQQQQADVELGAILDARRTELLSEGRPLLAPHV